jgi:hypothetical protein
MFYFTSFGHPKHAWTTLFWLALLGMTGLFGYVAVH